MTAFVAAGSGMAAANKAQRAFAAEGWARFSAGLPSIRVRMGLHTGVGRRPKRSRSAPRMWYDSRSVGHPAVGPLDDPWTGHRRDHEVTSTSHRRHMGGSLSAWQMPCGACSHWGWNLREATRSIFPTRSPNGFRSDENPYQHWIVPGGVPEWSNGAALKADGQQCHGGSNPSSSATAGRDADRCRQVPTAAGLSRRTRPPPARARPTRRPVRCGRRSRPSRSLRPRPCRAGPAPRAGHRRPGSA